MDCRLNFDRCRMQKVPANRDDEGKMYGGIVAEGEKK